MLGGSANSDCGLERWRRVCVSPPRRSFPPSRVVHTFSAEKRGTSGCAGFLAEHPGEVARASCFARRSVAECADGSLRNRTRHPPAPNGVARVGPPHPLIPAEPACRPTVLAALAVPTPPVALRPPLPATLDSADSAAFLHSAARCGE